MNKRESRDHELNRFHSERTNKREWTIYILAAAFWISPLGVIIWVIQKIIKRRKRLKKK